MNKIISPETRHLFLPRIMTYIIVGLFVLIIITNWKNIFNRIKLLKGNWRDMDLVKNKTVFWGTLILLFGYAGALNVLGFFIASIIYIFLTVLLFYKTVNKRTLIRATVTSFSVTTITWFLFGILLNITLP